MTFINRRTKRLNNLSKNISGFSMVEMMVTVVIVAVCLIPIARVFSICSNAISGIVNRSFAIDILQDEFEKIRVESLSQGGVEKNSFHKRIARGNRDIALSCNITPWIIFIEPTGLDNVEIEGEVEPIKKTSGLCEVVMIASWDTRGKGDSLTLKTFLPEKKLGRSPSELTGGE